MKRVFRLGLILVPFLFFLSTTAYPASAPGQHSGKHKHGRKPASVTMTQKDGETIMAVSTTRLNHRSQLDQVSAPAALPQSLPMQLASQARGVTPPIGSGIGVAAPVISW